MNKMRKYISVFLLQCLCVAAAFSQDAMRISGMQIVEKGTTMTIEAGRLVQFEAGATLIVKGSLVIQGTPDKPVLLKSSDEKTPGNGIMVSGIDEGGVIVMENVRASGLVQPLRFDPFWYRKSVDIKEGVFSGSTSGEPIIYVAVPLLDLRKGMDIQFTMKSMKFFNNSGSVLLEKVGSDGIVYNLDKLLFSGNTLPGSDATMGVLHLDIARFVAEDQIKMGELAFNRNFSGEKPVGVSMSGGDGTGSEKFAVDGVFASGNITDVIFDKRSNVRVPSLEVQSLSGLEKYSDEKNLILNSSHTFGKVKLKVSGNPTVVNLQDSFGRSVNNKAIRKGDTLELSYLEGNPTVLTLANGEKYVVPKLTAKELPKPIYRNIDTSQAMIGMSLDSLLSKIRDSLNTEDEKWKTWMEYGMWGGGAIYKGDFKPDNAIFPSTVEVSTGFYAQYKPFLRTAFRVTYYKAKISMNTTLAPALFFGTAPIYLPTNIGGEKGVFSPDNLWRFNFTTSLNVLDLETIIYLNRARNINFNNPNKWSMVSALGLGTSIIQFDPKRMVITDSNTYIIPLRPLGTEGQNFLPGKKQYGKYTGSFNLAYNMVFQKNRWLLKGEIKRVFSFSDYLDDWGNGKWYGGDYDKWVATLPKGNIDPSTKMDVNTLAGLGLYYETIYKKNGLDISQQKSSSSLLDGYFQFHLGIAYRIVSPVIKEKKKK